MTAEISPPPSSHRSRPMIRPRLAAWLLAVWLLCSCAVGADPAPTTTAAPPAAPAAAATAAPAAPPSPVTLTLWHSWTGRAAQSLDTLARQFEQLHPEVRISLVSRPAARLVRGYNEQVADGSAPQLLLVRGRYLGELTARQHILPLSTAFPTATLRAFVPAALTSAQVGGEQYGLPISMDALVFWYDRRALAAPPTSLAQLAAPTAAPAATPAPLTAAPPVALGYHLTAVTALPYLYALGGHLASATDRATFATTDRAITIRWLAYLQSLLSQPQLLASADLGPVDRALQTSRAVSTIDWSYRWADYAAVWGSDAVGVAALPPSAPSAAAPPSIVLTDVLCVNTVTTADQRRAAYALLAYLTSGESQTMLSAETNRLPTVQTATVTGSLRALRDATSHAAPLPPDLDSDTWTVLNDLVQSVLVGNVAPEPALDAAATELRRPSR